MAIAFVSGSAGAVFDSTPNSTSSYSGAQDVGATGSGNEVLVVVVHTLNGTTNTDSHATAATYNGVSMTLEAWSDGNKENVGAAISIFTLVAPATGSNTLAVTMAISHDCYVVQWGVYSGVDQTTAVDVSDSDWNSGIASLTGLTITTTETDTHVVYGVGARDGTNASFTPDGSGVERDETASGTATGGDMVGTFGDYAAATTGTYTDNATNGDSVPNKIAGVLIALRDDGSGGGATFVPKATIF
jgi:hypothetical protein